MNFEYKIYDNECELLKYIGFDDAVVIPEYVLDKPVVAIADGIFEGMNISTIELPKTLRYIGKKAFKGCYCLKKIDLPNSVMLCCEHAFQGCSSLEEINLGKVVYLGKGCFSECEKLEKVKMSNYLVDTGGECFSGCISLKNIQLSPNLGAVRMNDFYKTAISEVTIPSKTMLIEKYAFARCDQLKTIKSFSVQCEIKEDAFVNYEVHRPYKKDGTEDMRYDPLRYDFFVMRTIHCLSGSSFQQYARKRQYKLIKLVDIEQENVKEKFFGEIEDPLMYFSFNHSKRTGCSKDAFLKSVGLSDIEKRYCFHDDMQKFVYRGTIEKLPRFIKNAVFNFTFLGSGCKIYTIGDIPMLTYKNEKLVPYLLK